MKPPVRLTVVFVLTILSAVWGQGSAWALGPASPPIITFAAVSTDELGSMVTIGEDIIFLIMC